MHTLQNHSRKRELVIAGLIISALVVAEVAGCGTSNNQAPAATASVATAPEAESSSAQQARASAQQARAKAATTRARTSTSSSTEPSTGLVLAQIHQANLMEMALGKMAEEKASSDEVRAYADQLVRDHTSVDGMVVAMAQETGTNLKNGAEAHQAIRHQGALEKQEERKLKSAKGPDFDRIFLQQVSSDHDKLIRKLQQARKDSSDDELEPLIDKIVPILEQHRELAQILMKKEQALLQANQNHG
jgi:putative membrane protein